MSAVPADLLQCYDGNNPAHISCLRREYLLWKNLQAACGVSASKWPASIRRAFWSTNPDYLDRIAISSFISINNIDFLLIFEWMKQREVNKQIRAQVLSLVKSYYIHATRYKYFYSYNCMNNRYEFLNGKPFDCDTNGDARVIKITHLRAIELITSQIVTAFVSFLCRISS